METFTGQLLLESTPFSQLDSFKYGETSATRFLNILFFCIKITFNVMLIFFFFKCKKSQEEPQGTDNSPRQLVLSSD